MDTSLILILAILMIAGFMIWLDARNQEISRQFKADVEKGMDSLRQSVNRAVAQLGTENHSFGTASENSGMASDERDARKKTVTIDSVLLALRKNGYSPEIDPERPDSISFRIDDVIYMIEAGHLPYLVIYLGYRIDPSAEDQYLMCRAAQAVTDSGYIVKAGIHNDGKVLGFQVELFCDSYVHLRDTLSHYIQMLISANNRFGDHYEKLKKERDAAQSVTPFLPQSESETKILS